MRPKVWDRAVPGATTSSGAQDRFGKTQKRAGSIHAGSLARWLTLLAVKAKTQRLLRPLKHSDVNLSIFDMRIKITAFNNLAEAHALRFVAQNTSVPVPKVHCAFIHKSKTYIVMNKIDGQAVDSIWRTRPTASKKEIIRQLRVLFTDLRSISPAEGIGVANICGGPIFHPRLASSNKFLGPFSTTRDFHKELVHGADLTAGDGWLSPDLSELIIVKGDDVVGITDWEMAGWFPAYWEYVCTRNVPRRTFSRDEIDAFLDPMPRELVMEWVRRKYFGF